MDNPNLLNTIPTDELLKELMSRCAPACFIGSKIDGHNNTVNWWEISGNPRVAYGMLHELALTIQLSEIEKRLSA